MIEGRKVDLPCGFNTVNASARSVWWWRSLGFVGGWEIGNLRYGVVKRQGVVSTGGGLTDRPEVDVTWLKVLQHEVHLQWTCWLKQKTQGCATLHFAYRWADMNLAVSQRGNGVPHAPTAPIPVCSATKPYRIFAMIDEQWSMNRDQWTEMKMSLSRDWEWLDDLECFSTNYFPTYLLTYFSNREDHGSNVTTDLAG